MTVPTKLPHITDTAVDSQGRLNYRFYNAIQQALQNLQDGISQLSTVTGAVTDPATGEVTDLAAQFNSLKFSLGTLISSTGTGFLARNSANYVFRTFQDTPNLLWTNADGTAGNPSVELSLITASSGGALQKYGFDAYGRRTQEAAATTDDLPEGVVNLYFTDTRARNAAMTPYYIAVGDTFTVPEYKQAVSAMPITVDGDLVVDGYLVEV